VARRARPRGEAAQEAPLKRRLRVNPEAEEELVETAEWYEEQDPGLGLGLGLMTAVDRAVAALVAGGHGTPVPNASPGIRWTPVERFPLWVVFVEHDDEVEVVAFAHPRRSQLYWRRRVR
jgi:hypothetical protein